MSSIAVAWARKQKTGSGNAKVLLLLLADHASTRGECWPSQRLLSDQAEQSVDTVQRRLAELERRGLIYRVPARRWKDSGKWRTNMIVVLYDDICRSFALQHGFDPDALDADAQAVDEGGETVPFYDVSDTPENRQEFQDDETATGPQIAARSKTEPSETNGLAGGEHPDHAAICGTVETGDQAANCGMDRTANCGMDRTALVRHGTISRNSTTEPTPLNPLKAPSASASVKGSWLADWETLFALWPWADGETSEKAKRHFREMTPEDRGAVLAAAAIYLANRRELGQPIMTARRFLDEANFRRWRLAAKDHAARPNEAGAPVFVRKGTDAWSAWLGFKQKKSLPTVSRRIDGALIEGWVFPSLYPPRQTDSGERDQVGA